MSHAPIAITDLDSRSGLLAATRLYDPAVLFICGVLMTLGVTMVYSASVTVAGEPFDWRHWWASPLRQGAFALLGFLAMLVAAHVDYHLFAWERGRAWPAIVLLALGITLLIAVLIPGIGHHALGARRALVIPGLGLGFQPSEFAKIVLVVWLAAALTRPVGRISAGRKRFPLLAKPAAHGPIAYATKPAPDPLPPGHIRDLRTGFLPTAGGALLLIGLTGLEDFGTAALLGVVMVAMLLAGGARLTHIASIALLGLLGGIGLIIIKPHRIQRIITWFTADPDPAGAGYQINQALLAIGAGGWFGRGLGAGVQKYGYLPQDNNDFILAIVCEELGVVGGIAIVTLFLLLAWRGWAIVRNTPDPFGRLLALGLTLTICLQAAFNVGVVTNSVPTKGISLPFVSAGGSGVLFLGLAAGLLAAVGRPQASTSRGRTLCMP